MWLSFIGENTHLEILVTICLVCGLTTRLTALFLVVVNCLTGFEDSKHTLPMACVPISEHKILELVDYRQTIKIHLDTPAFTHFHSTAYKAHSYSRYQASYQWRSRLGTEVSGGAMNPACTN